MCRESESPYGGHMGRRRARRRNTHTAQGDVASCLALSVHCEAL